MKLDHAGARAAVAAHVAGLDLTDGVVILDEQTKRLRRGWLFFYQSETSARTGERSFQYVGSGGVLVDGDSGSLFELGSAYPTEWYVANFEATGDPLRQPGSSLELTEADAGRWKDAAPVLHRRLDMPIAEAKRVLEDAARGGTPVVRARNPQDATNLAEELCALGVRARQLPE